ncbi:MAG TPA: hypothetical protein VGD40_00605 [Chryseosolibacter sp.]
MTSELFRWVVIISTLSPVVPLVCLSKSWNRQPRQNLILALSILISLIFDATSWVIVTFYHRPNSLLNNLYFFLSFPVVMWFYHEILVRKSLKNATRIFTVIVFVLGMILFLRSGMNVMHHGLFLIASILISISSLLFIRDLNLMTASDFFTNKFHKTNIILNTSLALYSFTAVIVFSVSDYVYENASREGFRFFWAFHNALNILKNIGIAIAFYLSAKVVSSNEPR